MRLRVKNWGEFQHYKNRTPPWIKLHRGILDDFDFACLPLASKALAPLVWLLASESEDGTVDADTRRLAFRLRWNEAEMKEAVSGLISGGFLSPDGDASDALASCEQHACLEGEGETEVEREEETEEEGECAEPSRTTASTPQPPPDDPVVMAFPMVGKPGEPEWPLHESKVAEWRESFPHLDVMAALRAARQWLRDNPARRKTDKGMAKFLGGWLARDQNRGTATARPASGFGGSRPAPQGLRTSPYRDDERPDGTSRCNPETDDLERWDAAMQAWKPYEMPQEAAS